MKFLCTIIVLAAIIMMFALPVVAAGSGAPVKVYTIQGRLIGTVRTERAPHSLELRPLSSVPVQTPAGDGATLAAGMYLVAPPEYVPPPWSGSGVKNGFSFQDVTATRLPQGDMQGGDVKVADINGDGREDIVFSLYSSICDSMRDMRPRVWVQTESGEFVDETSSRIPAVYGSARHVEVLDADGDGDLDIFLSGSGCTGNYPQAVLLLNDGHGVFTDESDARLPKIPGDGFVYSVSAGLLDDNRSIDLALVAWDVSTQFPVLQPALWLNDGSGVYQLDTAGRLPNSPKYGFSDVFVSDLTKDTINDLLFGNTFYYVTGPGGPEPIDSMSGQTAIFRNLGDGYFADETGSRMPAGFHRGTRTIALGDVDHDGNTDILEIGFLYGWNADTPQVRLFRNDGSGHFSILQDSVVNALHGWFNDAKFGNLNADGYPDLFLAKVSLGQADYDKLLINSPGGAGYRDSSQLLPSRLDFSVACALFDYQHDSDLDIVIANSGPTMGTGGQSALYQNMLYDVPEGVSPDPRGPRVFTLHQNFPNPFNPSTTIRYTLQKGGNVSLTVYTSLGQPVRTLVSEYQTPGDHSARWNPAGLATGIYFYRLMLDGTVLDRKSAVYLR